MIGINEILILAALLFGLILYPRISAARRPTARSAPAFHPIPQLSGPMRLAIAASLFWTAAAAIYFQPWEAAGEIPFLAYGVGPVVLLWGANWVRAGFRAKKR